MRAIGIKALKNQLSAYVRLAAGGETVLVTDRDRVVAELVPPRADREPSVSDALLAEALRRGWMAPALVTDGSAPPSLPVTTLEVVLAELEADRSGR